MEWQAAATYCNDNNITHFASARTRVCACLHNSLSIVYVIFPRLFICCVCVWLRCYGFFSGSSFSFPLSAKCSSGQHRCSPNVSPTHSRMCNVTVSAEWHGDSIDSHHILMNMCEFQLINFHRNDACIYLCHQFISFGCGISHAKHRTRTHTQWLRHIERVSKF